MEEPRTKCLLPSIFNEGVIMSSMCLTAVDDNSDKFIVLRDGDFLPGRASWGAVTSALAAFSTAVLSSHSCDGVGLHVKNPGELCKNNIKSNKSYLYLRDLRCKNLRLPAKENPGLENTLYPNLFIIFDWASAFPVKAEAHEVNTENVGQGFDASPLHCGPLCRKMQKHIVNKHHINVLE